MDENNPSAIPGGDDVDSSEGENVSAPDVLSEINKASGRNYPSVDEALKGIRNTYSSVGEKKVAPNLNVSVEDKSKPELRADVEALKWRNDKLEFLFLNPEAIGYADEIGAIAHTKNIGWQEAYDNSKFKSLIKEKARAGEETPVVETGQRITQTGKTVGLTRDEFSRLPLADQKRIVESLPTWYSEFKDSDWNKLQRGRNADIY